MNVNNSCEQRLAESVSVVLVRTTHAGNIGAVARAMKNMGLRKLVLVTPSETREFDHSGDEYYVSPLEAKEAVRRAAGAEDLLKSAKICSSLDEALTDSQVVIGASARNRKMTWPLMNPRDCADLLMDKVFPKNSDSTLSEANQVSLIFGNEASGLSNDELHRCHYHVNIPSVEGFSSLNLAMAVQVVAYEVRMALLLNPSVSEKYNENQTTALNEQVQSSLSPSDAGWDEALASVEDVEGFFAHLEKTLIAIGFHDPENPRQLMVRLRRLYQRAHLDRMEVNIMRGILTATLKAKQSRNS